MRAILASKLAYFSSHLLFSQCATGYYSVRTTGGFVFFFDLEISTGSFNQDDVLSCALHTVHLVLLLGSHATLEVLITSVYWLYSL